MQEGRNSVSQDPGFVLLLSSVLMFDDLQNSKSPIIKKWEGEEEEEIYLESVGFLYRCHG